MTVKNLVKGVLTAALMGITVSGGAVVAANDSEVKVEDPFEGFNRSMHEFNRGLNKAILNPLIETYRVAVPKWGRERIHNAAVNATQPWSAFNSLLQADFDGFAGSSGRFMINTTVGIFGLFQVVGDDIPPGDEDFGQTLGYWGVKPGPYIVWPILGPSNGRDSVGLVVDYVADPVDRFLDFQGADRYRWIEDTGILVDKRDSAHDILNDIEKKSLDSYAALRTMYMQRREAMVRNAKTNGKKGDVPLPDVDFDEDDKL